MPSVSLAVPSRGTEPGTRNAAKDCRNSSTRKLSSFVHPRVTLLETRYAVEAAKAGYFFSVPPIICRSPGFQALVKAVPLESLLLETDSPALVSGT